MDGKDETEERRLNSTNAQSIGKEKLLQLIARRLYYSERITPVLDDREVMDIIHAHVHITETRK